METHKSLTEYLEFAKQLALKAGKIINENFKLGMQRGYKDDGSVVTNTDIAVNKLVIEEISRAYPKHNLLGEEESNLHHKTEPTWVCDPLDGTVSFTTGIPTFTFSLALTINGEPMVAVVYDPTLDRLFHAVKGGGCFMNDERVTVSSRSEFNASTNVCMPFRKGISYDGKDGRYFALIETGMRVISIPSMIFFGALVAAGELDGVVFTPNTAHDAAAIAILIEEAGGVATDLHGKRQRYDQPTAGFIGANPQLHQKILAVFQTDSEVG